MEEQHEPVTKSPNTAQTSPASAAATAPALDTTPPPAATTHECEMEIVRRVCAGERELFCELIKPYQHMLYMTALGIVKTDHDAEEIVQEAVFKAFKNIAKFRGEAKFSTWLVQITINEGRLFLRRNRRAPMESLDSGNENDEGDHVPIDCADWREIPSETLDRKELREALRRAITNLKPIYRDVLVLRDVDHFSVAETAASLNISEASVKTRLLRARLQLRDALAPGYDGSWSTRQVQYQRVRPF